MEGASFIVSPELKITSCSAAFERLVGKSLAEIKNKRYSSVIPPLNEKRSDAVEMAIKKGISKEVRCRFSCIYGAVSATAFVKPLIKANGVEGAVVILKPEPSCTPFTKISELEALKERTEATFRIAHNLRNPLNAIMGALSYIKDTYPEDKRISDFITIIEEEVAYLNNMISEILLKGAPAFHHQREDIETLLKRIETLTSLQTESKGIKTEFEYTDLQEVEIDPFQTEQAILNVINNSIEAMPEGGTLQVRGYIREVQDRRFVVIEVSDTGKGFGYKDMGEYASNCRNRGFGLYITNEILKLQGGFSEIRPNDPKGTIVSLYIPISRDAGSGR